MTFRLSKFYDTPIIPHGQDVRPRVREDKDEPARCPFCNNFLDPPDRLETEMGETLGGRCGCGAVYTFDPTGHNVGEAYFDALSLAYGKEWSLASEDTYVEEVLNYDARKHRLTPIKEIRRLELSGRMVFIKVRDRIDK